MQVGQLRARVWALGRPWQAGRPLLDGAAGRPRLRLLQPVCASGTGHLLEAAAGPSALTCWPGALPLAIGAVRLGTVHIQDTEAQSPAEPVYPAVGVDHWGRVPTGR